MIDLAASAFG